VRCPICGGVPVVVDQGVFGVLAHCGECYEGDPEASEWRRLQARADHPEDALELWYERARDFAACDEIPSMPIPYKPARLFSELEAQVDHEFASSLNWRKIREGKALLWRPC